MIERIPIRAGFYIGFAVDGRALSRGLEESMVLPAVLFWLRTHRHDDADYERVQHWARQKENQLQEDLRQNQVKAKREEIRASVYRAARLSKLHDDELTEIIFTEMLKRHGIPEEEEI